MREQVLVLPPFLERRKIGFSSSEKEEALPITSKDSEVCTAFEGGIVEKITGFALIGREAIQTEADLASAERMQDADVRGAPLSGACKEERQRNIDEAPERMKSSPSSSDIGALLRQWGAGKRARCSRVDTHGSSRQVRNNSLKPGCNLVDEYSLLCKTVCIQADSASPAQLNTRSLASKEIFKTVNGIAAKKEHLLSEDNRSQQAKDMKEVLSDVRYQTRGSSPGGEKRRYSSHHKQDQSLQQSKIGALPVRNSSPQDHCAAPLTAGSNGVGLSKTNNVPWPRLIIALSRKEKEEDFLILKGSKLPQRSKRRPKVIEKALHYCTPGRWLVDILESRYGIVREKKRARKERRGLKAMASLDSDSD